MKQYPFCRGSYNIKIYDKICGVFYFLTTFVLTFMNLGEQIHLILSMNCKYFGNLGSSSPNCNLSSSLFYGQCLTCFHLLQFYCQLLVQCKIGIIAQKLQASKSIFVAEGFLCICTDLQLKPALHWLEILAESRATEQPMLRATSNLGLQFRFCVHKRLLVLSCSGLRGNVKRFVALHCKLLALTFVCERHNDNVICVYRCWLLNVKSIYFLSQLSPMFFFIHFVLQYA